MQHSSTTKHHLNQQAQHPQETHQKLPLPALHKDFSWQFILFHNLTLRKIAKNLTFFQNKLPKIFIFFKNIYAFFLKKMKIFGNFFWKNVKFLAIFWQSNGNFPEGQYYTSTRLRRLTLTGMSDLGIMLAKLPPNGTIHDFFRWDFSTFWLCEPKFTEFWTEKVHNLSHLRRI